MKKGIFFLFFIYLFSYQLVIKKSDIPSLEEIGLSCSVENNNCILMESRDLKKLLSIKSYLKSEYMIDSKIINNNDMENKKSKIKSNFFNEKIVAYSFDDSEIKKSVDYSLNIKFPKKVLKHIYSYQLATFKNLNNAKKLLNKIKNYRYVRIEKIKGYYVIRIGIYFKYKIAKREYKYLKNKLKYGILIKCFYIPNRVVFYKGG